jgi:hypothetical protein
MSEQAEMAPEARKEANRKHRERAIHNLESALSYLRLPDDQIDEEQRAWGAMVGISAATYAICQTRVTLVVTEEDGKSSTADETPDGAFMQGARVN